MKKLLMVMTIILVAGLSQAASVNWNSGILYVPLADGTFSATKVPAGSSGYSAVVSFFLADGTTPFVVTGNTSSTITIGNSLSGTSTGFAVSTTYYAVIAITDVNGGGYLMTSTKSQFTTPANGTPTINFRTGAGFATTSDKLPSKWTPIPEPATFALMGVGLAVLGLRRRFMKK